MVMLEKVEYEYDFWFDGEEFYLVILEVRMLKGKKVMNDFY